MSIIDDDQLICDESFFEENDSLVSLCFKC
jgi:hypothetical protein